MPLLCASSDRGQERAGHFAFAAELSALGWFASTLSGYPGLQLVGLIAATAGGFSAMPVLWTHRAAQGESGRRQHRSAQRARVLSLG